MPQIQFNKGIKGLPDKLTATIVEEPYYLRIKITKLVFTEGFDKAAELVIEIADKDKLTLAEYTALNPSAALNSLDIYKEYEFVINEFKLHVDESSLSKFNFILYYEDINV